jgi:serine/threonine protein kinase
MEPREEATLADAMARAPLPVPELLRRAIELASALNQLHRQGRVHGAVEPADIVLTPAGIELGEAPSGPRTVTAYTAPEQLREITDARSDIFSFGAVIYELATGGKAFAGDTPAAVADAILEDQPPSIKDLPHDPDAAAFYTALDRVVTDCLVKNPDQRRQRMHNVLVDLKLMSSLARAAAPKPLGGIHPPRPAEAKPIEPRTAEPLPTPAAAPENLASPTPEPALPALRANRPRCRSDALAAAGRARNRRPPRYRRTPHLRHPLPGALRPERAQAG